VTKGGAVLEEHSMWAVFDSDSSVFLVVMSKYYGISPFVETGE